MLCHQFSTSSLSLLENCIKRCSTCAASDETPGGSHPPEMIKHRRPGPKHPKFGIPTELWLTVMQRVVEQKEPLRSVAVEYGVSHETIRRILLHAHQQRGQQNV
jgi:hypothetical protein